MAKKRKDTPISFHKRLALSAAGVVGATLLALFSPKGKPVEVPAYVVSRVFDGDTFETVEKQYIRLSGIDAPETGLCGSQQAKTALEQLVLGKKLYIKVLYHQGARSNGLVYTEDGLVNARMLKMGWAVKNDRDNVDMVELQEATDLARKQKIGIFSSQCTQMTNPDDPACLIKGNRSDENTKIYHLPGCQQYKITEVQLYKGDQWFCTEQEAREAGFVKGKQCP